MKLDQIKSLGLGLFTISLGILLATFLMPSPETNVYIPPPLEPVTPREPSRIVIKAIGVDALVQSVGLSPKNAGEMDSPTNFMDVGWYNKGPLPGMVGSAVITGHKDGKKVPKAVFYDLNRLKIDDLIEITDYAGKTWQFKVLGNKTYNYTDSTSEIFSNDTSKSRLNLITCTGNWIKSEKVYDQRLVVFTELVTNN